MKTCSQNISFFSSITVLANPYTMAVDFDIEPVLGAARACKDPISFRHGAWATLFEIASFHTPVQCHGCIWMEHVYRNVSGAEDQYLSASFGYFT